MSWVFHASKPWPIVIGKTINPPPNLEACVCSQKKIKASDAWGINLYLIYKCIHKSIKSMHADNKNIQTNKQ